MDIVWKINLTSSDLPWDDVTSKYERIQADGGFSIEAFAVKLIGAVKGKVNGVTVGNFNGIEIYIDNNSELTPLGVVDAYEKKLAI